MGETNSEDRAKYDFKKDMQEIQNYRGRGTELISVYVPATKQISDVMAYLRNEQSQASNIKSKTTMKNVQSAIDSIAARLKTYKAPPANGVVIFCGEVPRAGDQTKMVQYVINPPEPITAFLYRCDSTFFTDPLQSMLLDKKCYGLITIDRSEATIGILSGSRIQVLKHFDSLVPSKHHQGGQSSVRFERLIEIAKMLRKNKTKVIVLAGRRNSTIIPYADEFIYAAGKKKVEEFWNSMFFASGKYILDILYEMEFSRKYEENLKLNLKYEQSGAKRLWGLVDDTIV